MTEVSLTAIEFKMLEEHGCLMETFDNLVNKVDYVYYYHPEVSKKVFRREASNWKFVKMDVEEIENGENRGDMERIILMNFPNA